MRVDIRPSYMFPQDKLPASFELYINGRWSGKGHSNAQCWEIVDAILRRMPYLMQVIHMPLPPPPPGSTFSEWGAHGQGERNR